MTNQAAILFDLDGTLVDTLLDFQAIATELRTSAGMGAMSDSTRMKFRQNASNGARTMVRIALECDENDPMIDRYVSHFLDVYAQHCARYSRVFFPLDRFLQELETRHIAWGVVTNKPVRFAKPLLQQLALWDRCSALICPEDVKQAKPHPEGILLAMKQMGLEPTRRSVYIGDHERDIISGRDAGLTTIAAGYGYVSPDDDLSRWHSDYVVHSPEELVSLLRAHFE